MFMGETATKTVREIQLALKSKGIDPGPIDGKNGPKTTAALAVFQKANGLKPDGQFGPVTANLLFAAKPTGSTIISGARDAVMNVIASASNASAAGILGPAPLSVSPAEYRTTDPLPLPAIMDAPLFPTAGAPASVPTAPPAPAVSVMVEAPKPALATMLPFALLAGLFFFMKKKG